MTDEEERVRLDLTQHDARELYEVTTEALSDDPDNSALARCSGALLAVLADDEWLEDRNS